MERREGRASWSLEPSPGLGGLVLGVLRILGGSAGALGPQILRRPLRGSLEIRRLNLAWFLWILLRVGKVFLGPIGERLPNTNLETRGEQGGLRGRDLGRGGDGRESGRKHSLCGKV